VREEVILALASKHMYLRLVQGSFLVYPYFGVREITSARNDSWVQVEPEAAGAVVSNAEAPCHY
jgi:hypothetical protein